MDFHNTLTAPGLLRCLLLIPQCHSSDSCATTNTIQLSHLQISVNQSPGNAPLLAIMTTNNTISGPTVDFGTVADRNRFIINLSVRHANTANPRVHVKTTRNLIVYSNDYHPQDHVYQSAVYYEILRYTPHISVTIELGRHCALADRIAMNHILAGLLTFLDEEADVETLQFRVLDGHRFTTAELVEVLQPVAMWIGKMPNVGVRHFGPLAELHHALVQARRSHSPSDDSRWGLPGLLQGLNREMAEIMADVRFVSPGKSAEPDIAAEKVRVVLGKLSKALQEVSDILEVQISYAEAAWYFFETTRRRKARL
jgi:hypothetical protein